ncbi:3-phosphoshikimate 1-carboxyvinyltransferase [Streptomyces violaceus]|uniref:3-phosphoshikimate 1-carboxyvinyltransferase n=1 Tax=Streptomyces violaceus TaxID=1936 RepID=A0ABY9UKY8_STRVL|nr:3-phosphoshikimate 1-carboxyvinyltransferase [Streptomyces janthinus]WND23534.1 3-phosphoshikimate 1-carboxyvinyltransferase [Streptomyces janthinus]GGS98445.1 3-phosphoshikimate 1-carboxyvinyltransferase [Streptomyces janthinus]
MTPAVPAADLDAVSSLQVTGAGPARGTLQVPGDKSISHRALLLSAMAHGPSVITGLSRGQDVTHTLRAIERFGVVVTDAGEGRVRVEGPLRHEPDDVLDHGNAGTGIRLMSGVCAGIDGLSVLTGDQFLRRRPMDRVAVPLGLMGAAIDGRERGRLAPLVIHGGGLTGITYSPKVASAQVKSAVLLAGLSAKGSTTVEEIHPTRRHTEEMLDQFGARVRVEGHAVTVEPGELTGTDVRVPGDPSQAAFWAVAALLADEGEVIVEGLYPGYGRSDFVGVLKRMGADVDFGLSTGVLTVRSSRLKAVELTAEDIPGIVDEVPVLAMAAAVAEGTTVISGAGDLRAKESDRIASTSAMLRAFGVRVTETEDGMVIEGASRLRPARVDSHGDHRIAMTAAVAGACAAEGTTVIDGWDSVATSYPRFAADLVRLTRAGVEQGA